jgi:hypothetical protein
VAVSFIHGGNWSPRRKQPICRKSLTRRGRAHMIVRFITTYAISIYHPWMCEFEPRSWRVVLDTTLCGLFVNFTVFIFIFLFVSLHSAVYCFNIYNFIFLIHFVRQLSQDWRSLHYYETDILLHTIYEIISTTIIYYQWRQCIKESNLPMTSPLLNSHLY